MATAVALIERNPVLSYFALTFAVSWGVILTVFGPGGFPVTPEQLENLLPFAIVAMLSGPSVAGLLSTGLVSGRAGLRDLLARSLRWRVDVRWYAVALLTAPLLTTSVLLGLSLRSAEFLPAVVTTDGIASLLLLGLTAGLVVGIFEELGWTGFATPRLRLRHGVLATGVIVGLLWGLWHFLLFWEGDTFSGALPLAILLGRLLSWTPAYRVLMVWVYDRTGSLPVAMLMHASLTATQFILVPRALSGVALLTYVLLWAAVLWIAVAAVAALRGSRLWSPPPPRQTA
jgi:uncharacterized protein